MSEELELLKTIAQRLNKIKIPYFISGSMAMNYYSVPRMTRDIDIVIGLTYRDIDKFCTLFQSDFYLDKQAIKKEVSQGGMFNVIHNEYVIKADFIVRKRSGLQDSAFSRKRKVIIDKTPVWIISAEDLVLAKLIWAKDSNSELQIKDVRNIFMAVKDLDIKYIEKWAKLMKLQQIYKEARNERHQP